MTIKGVVARVAPGGVLGWCIDDENDQPVEVEVRIGGVFVGKVRADIPREDIRARFGRSVSGYRFPFSERLYALLAHRARVDVETTTGESLRVAPHCDPHIDNPSQPDMDELRQLLTSGYTISAKTGKLFLPLGRRDIDDIFFHALNTAGDIFRDIFSKDLFLCYGTLLGCIRSDDFIPHDDDVDVAFFAESDGFDAAMAEFRTVVARLRGNGQSVSVSNKAHLHWQVANTVLDVFMVWTEGERIYMYSAGGDLGRERFLPLRHTLFKRRHVLVPNDPDSVLEFIYGSGWRVPDPMFQWRLSPDVAAKMAAVRLSDAEQIEMATLGESAPGSTVEGPTPDAPPPLNMGDDRDRHWTNFYRQPHTTLPSPFGAAVALELTQPHWVLDLGCGNGRDTLHFARQGHHVLGLDAAENAIERNSRASEAEGIRKAAFVALDLTAPHAATEVIRQVVAEADALDRRVVVYSRFFLHAIAEEQENVVLRTLAETLPIGTRCYFEFRTKGDAHGHKRFGDHYRRFLDLHAFVAKAARLGFECTYRVEGRGLAKFELEDPQVGRAHLRLRGVE